MARVRIVVSTDFSENARAAYATARDLAQALEAESGRAARRMVVKEMGERFTEHLEHGGGTGRGEEDGGAEAGAPEPRAGSESGPVLTA